MESSHTLAARVSAFALASQIVETRHLSSNGRGMQDQDELECRTTFSTQTTTMHFFSKHQTYHDVQPHLPC